MQLKVGLTQQGELLYLTYEDISKINSCLHRLCGVFTVQNVTFGAPSIYHGSARIFFKRSIVFYSNLESVVLAFMRKAQLAVILLITHIMEEVWSTL